MIRNKSTLIMSTLFLSLVSLNVWGQEENWKRIKSCEEENLVIHENKEMEFRLKMRGKAVDYFLLQKVIFPHEINAEKEFIISLFKGDGHFRARLAREEGEIIIDLHDYGNITLIASRESAGKNIRQELAVWNYRHCRGE